MKQFSSTGAQLGCGADHASWLASTLAFPELSLSHYTAVASPSPDFEMIQNIIPTFTHIPPTASASWGARDCAAGPGGLVQQRFPMNRSPRQEGPPRSSNLSLTRRLLPVPPGTHSVGEGGTDPTRPCPLNHVSTRWT